MTEARLSSIYESEGLGGETTMRAKVIRELIDEINLDSPRGGSRCRVPNPDSESGGALAWAWSARPLITSRSTVMWAGSSVIW